MRRPVAVVKIEPSRAATTLKSRVLPRAGGVATAARACVLRRNEAGNWALAADATVRSILRSVDSNCRWIGLSSGDRDGVVSVEVALASELVPSSQSTAVVGSPTLANCATTRYVAPLPGIVRQVPSFSLLTV